MYTVLEAFVLQELIDKVRQHLTNGWELKGDLVVVVDKNNNLHYFQAMIQP